MSKISLAIMPPYHLRVLSDKHSRNYIDMKRTLAELQHPILLINTPLDLHNISLRMKFDTTVYYPDTSLIQDCNDLTVYPAQSPTDKPIFKTKNILYIRKPITWISEMISSHDGNNNVDTL